MDASQFRRLNNLGEGVDTIVYRGYDGNLQRYVAIKELKESQRSDPRRVEQFFREASFLAGVKHDNVLQIYSADRASGRLVMELMQGTLADLVKTSAMKPDLVRSVLRQVLSALEFLHGQGRIHGNIRPSNLLIDEFGRVKLSDFEGTQVDGELRVPKNHTKYVAPELLNREFGPLSPALDIYSAGFTTLELLMGSKFDSTLIPGGHVGDPMAAWLRWHGSPEAYCPVREYVPRIPDDLADVLDRMLCKKVAERPTSAAQVIRLLDDLPLLSVPTPKQSESVEPTPPLTPSFGPPPQGANPVVEQQPIAYEPKQYKRKPKKQLSEAEKKQKSKNLTNILAGILTFLVVFVGGMMILPSSNAKKLKLEFDPKTVVVEQVTIDVVGDDEEKKTEGETLNNEEDGLEVEEGVLTVKLEESLLDAKAIELRLTVAGFQDAVVSIEPAKQDFEQAIAVELTRPDLALVAGSVSLQAAQVSLNGVKLESANSTTATVTLAPGLASEPEQGVAADELATPSSSSALRWRIPREVTIKSSNNLLLVEVPGYLPSELKTTAEQLTSANALTVALTRPTLRVKLDVEDLNGQAVSIRLGELDVTGTPSNSDPSLFEFKLPEEFFTSPQTKALLQIAGFLPWEKTLTLADLGTDKPLAVELEEVTTTKQQLTLVLTPGKVSPGSVLWNGRSIEVKSVPGGSFVSPFASGTELKEVNQLDIVVDGFRPWQGRVRRAQIENAIPVDVPLEKQVPGEPLRVALLVGPSSVTQAILRVNDEETVLTLAEDQERLQHIIEVTETASSGQVVIELQSESYEPFRISKTLADLRESPLLLIDLVASSTTDGAGSGSELGTASSTGERVKQWERWLTEGAKALAEAKEEFEKRKPHSDEIAIDLLETAIVKFEQLIAIDADLKIMLEQFPDGSEAIIGLAEAERYLRKIGLRAGDQSESLEQIKNARQIDNWDRLARSALDRVESLLTIDAENDYWRVFAIDTAKEAKLFDSQISHLNVYLESHPEDHLRRYDRIVAQYDLAQGKLSREQWEVIQSEAKQCLNLDENVAKYQRILGEASSNLGQWDEAIRAYERSLELDDQSAAGQYGLLVAMHSRFKDRYTRFETDASDDKLRSQLDEDRSRIVAMGNSFLERHSDSSVSKEIRRILDQVERISF